MVNGKNYFWYQTTKTSVIKSGTLRRSTEVCFHQWTKCARFCDKEKFWLKWFGLSLKNQQGTSKIGPFSGPHFHVGHTWDCLQTKTTAGAINLDCITRHSSTWIPCPIVCVSTIAAQLHDLITLFHHADGSTVNDQFRAQKNHFMGFSYARVA